jgi:hypothetical protein
MKKVSLLMALIICIILAGCASQPQTGTVTRDMIEATFRALNAAENNRPNTSVEKTIADADAMMAPDVEGWDNGVHKPDREVERQNERILFAAMPDYHRSIEHMVIDPPYGAFNWTITGTVFGKPTEVKGCSLFEFNAAGKIRRYWLYFNNPWE